MCETEGKVGGTWGGKEDRRKEQVRKSGVCGETTRLSMCESAIGHLSLGLWRWPS